MAVPGFPGGVLGPVTPGVPTLTAEQVNQIVAAHAREIMNHTSSVVGLATKPIYDLTFENFRLLAQSLSNQNTILVSLANLNAGVLNLGSMTGLIANTLSVGLTNISAGLVNVGVGLTNFGMGMNNFALSLMNMGNALLTDAINRANLYRVMANAAEIVIGIAPTTNAILPLIKEILEIITDPEKRKKFLEQVWNALVEIFRVVVEKVAEPFKTRLAEMFASLSALSQATTTSDASGVLATMNMIWGKYTNTITETLVIGLLTELLSLGQLDQVARTMMDALSLMPIGKVADELFFLEYEVGVKPKVVQYLRRKHLPEIPSPSELITMVVREAFDPRFVTPAPEIFAKYMELQGFSKEWSDRFWTAHWRWVPNETAIDMFHRGIISMEDLQRTFIINDVHPQTLEWWTKYIYRLPNRVEARIMGRFGLLTQEQMDRILKAEGIDPEFIPALRTMIFEYHLGSVQTKIESFAISAYEDGMISAEVFRQWMTVARFPESVIALAQQLADYKRNVAIRQEKRKLIKTWAKKGYLSYDEAIAALQSLGIEPDVLSLDAEEIRVHRIMGEESELDSLRNRILNAALSAYDDGLLNRAEFVNILRSMNLSDTVINAYAQLAEYRRIWGLRGELIRAYLALYRRGVMSFEDAYSAMVNAGVDPEFAYAKLLTIKQTVEVTKPPKIDLPGDKLTVAQILDALKTGVITIDEAAEFLRNKGYDPTEIAVILNTFILKRAGG